MTESCWEWGGSRYHDGYGRIYDPNVQKSVPAHRFFFEKLVGPIPKDRLVLHRCDNRSCVRPDHLFLGDYKDNTQDMMLKGRHNPVRGQRNSHAKLTAAQVSEIRMVHENERCTQVELAKRYGVNQSSISRIINRKRWG